MCEACGKVREPHPNVWEGTWALYTGPCEDCASAEFAAMSLRLARENALRKYELVDGKYGGMSFDTYQPDPKHPSQAKAKQVAMDVVQAWRDGNWERGLMLVGSDYGIGKTHLAISAAREGVQVYAPGGGQRILAVWGMPKLLRSIRDSYNNGGPAEIMETVTDSGIVVLDDIGVEHFKQESWYQEIVYDIFNERWLHQRATVVTTNAGPGTLRQHVGERTWSRMMALVGTPIKMTGEDYRSKAHE